MIYAAVIVCGLRGCVFATDPAAPYATEAECRAAHDARRAEVVTFARTMGAQTIRELCGTLDEVRRHIPGAFEGEQTT